MVKQTAGHDALGQFAPNSARLNDDVLFGEVWNRTDKLGLKERSIVTISALIGKGITDSSLKYHLMSAKNNGVTQVEMAEILTHIAFYAGWPNAWAAFNIAKGSVRRGRRRGSRRGRTARRLLRPGRAERQLTRNTSPAAVLPQPGDRHRTRTLPIFNVTFEPGCRNNWHIHHADKGGGQLLICVAWRGLVSGRGQARAGSLNVGDVVDDPRERQALARRARRTAGLATWRLKYPGEEYVERVV